MNSGLSNLYARLCCVGYKTVRTCACLSLSGGQGKTTVVLFTALLLARLGKRVLAVDSDPQANLTFYLNRLTLQACMPTACCR